MVAKQVKEPKFIGKREVSVKKPSTQNTQAVKKFLSKKLNRIGSEGRLQKRINTLAMIRRNTHQITKGNSSRLAKNVGSRV
jgi:hypothetical protein